MLAVYNSNKQAFLRFLIVGFCVDKRTGDGMMRLDNTSWMLNFEQKIEEELENLFICYQCRKCSVSLSISIEVSAI